MSADRNNQGFTKRDMRMVLRGGLYSLSLLLNDLESDLISEQLREKMSELGEVIAGEMAAFDVIDQVNECH